MKIPVAFKVSWIVCVALSLNKLLPAATQPTTAPLADVDQSLMLIEYAAKGVPAPERPWTVADYRKAIAALRKLDASQLPRKDSPKSGALFRRMASPENLDPLIHPSRRLPLKDRLTNIDFAEVTTGVLILYPEFDERFMAERAALACNVLRACRWTVPLEDELLGSVPKSSRTYDNIARIVEQRRSGYGEMTDQLTRWLQGSKHLDSAGRVALVKAMVDLLPEYISVLPVENQKQIWDSLRKAWDANRSEAVRDELKKLAAAIQKLATTQPAPASGNAGGGT